MTAWSKAVYSSPDLVRREACLGDLLDQLPDREVLAQFAITILPRSSEIHPLEIVSSMLFAENVDHVPRNVLRVSHHLYEVRLLS